VTFAIVDRGSVLGGKQQLPSQLLASID